MHSVADERILDEPNGQSAESTQIFYLKPEKLILSTFKNAESKDALVVRAYNSTNQSLDASLDPGVIKFARVERVLFNENSFGNEKAMHVERKKNEECLFTVDAYIFYSLSSDWESSSKALLLNILIVTSARVKVPSCPPKYYFRGL
jgi:hypothetical protein